MLSYVLLAQVFHQQLCMSLVHAYAFLVAVTARSYIWMKTADLDSALLSRTALQADFADTIVEKKGLFVLIQRTELSPLQFVHVLMF